MLDPISAIFKAFNSQSTIPPPSSSPPSFPPEDFPPLFFFTMSATSSVLSTSRSILAYLAFSIAFRFKSVCVVNVSFIIVNVSEDLVVAETFSLVKEFKEDNFADIAVVSAMIAEKPPEIKFLSFSDEEFPPLDSSFLAAFTGDSVFFLFQSNCVAQLPFAFLDLIGLKLFRNADLNSAPFSTTAPLLSAFSLSSFACSAESRILAPIALAIPNTDGPSPACVGV